MRIGPGRFGFWLTWICMATGAFLGCSAQEPPTASSVSVLRDLRIVSGNNQVGRSGEPLALPFLVEAVDAQGDPLRGTAVLFAVTSGGGRLSETVSVTDAQGRAQTRLTLGPAAGINHVTATASGLSGLPPTFTASAESTAVDAPTGPVYDGVRLFVSADPDTILVDGIARSTLYARLELDDGTPVSNSAVRFATTLGSVSSETVETDRDGVAKVILIAGQEAGKAIVTARFGAGTVAQTSVVFVKGPPTSIVVIETDPPEIGVRGAGTNETSIVTFEVRDGQGKPVADGESVLFRLDAPGGGTERVGPERTVTVQGRVQAAVSSGTLAHTIRLIAEVPLVSGDTIRSTPVPIAIHGGLPDRNHFSLAVEPVNLAGRVLFGLESTITAFVFDRYSNPVSPGTSVRFRTDGGGVQGASVTNADGQTFVVLFTAAPIPPGPGFLATITGQTVDAAGQEIEAYNTVLFSGPTAPVRLTSAGSDSILAGRLFIPEGGFHILSFSVSDISGHPIMGGSTIRVSSDVARVSGDAEIVIPDARSGNVDFAVTLSDPQPFEDPPAGPKRGSVLIQVRSKNGDQQLTFGLTVD